MKKLTDPRHTARLLAVQTIYQNQNSNSLKFELSEIIELSEVGNYDKALYNSIVSKIDVNREEIDKLLKQFAVERPLDQISKINLIIMENAVLESRYLKTAPKKVLIDESIELAKDFGTGVDASFINGVLDHAI